jgi:hypothetical protein
MSQTTTTQPPHTPQTMSAPAAPLSVGDMWGLTIGGTFLAAFGWLLLWGGLTSTGDAAGGIAFVGLLIWLGGLGVISYTGAALARSRGRDVGGWAAACFFTGLLGLVILALMSPAGRATTAPAPPATPGTALRELTNAAVQGRGTRGIEHCG